MRVENMKVDGAAVTARVYLQASRTPKTTDPFKRAASWEKSVRKAFEYRGWLVDVENVMPVNDNPSILDVLVYRKNDERRDDLRECRRWNVRTQAERVVNDIYRGAVNAYDVLIDTQNERIASEHDTLAKMYTKLFSAK